MKLVCTAFAGLLAVALMSGAAYAQPVPGGGGGVLPTSPIGDSGHAAGWNGTSWYSQAITGGSAAAGGSNTQLQYNQSGALAGISGATTNGTAVTLTSPVLVTPALGTPASGVGTNLTGTASGLTAGNVTTNANLTGPITSSGNATSIASQTGTGSKFVVDTSPTLVTPNLGTPSAATLTNATGLPVSTGVSGLGTGVATALAITHDTTGGICTVGGTGCTGGGSVSVTSASSNIVINPTPGTGTFTVGATYAINAQTGTTYTIVSGDMGKLVTFSNASAIAVTLPVATTSGFGAGASFDVQNLGLGTVTITPTTSTINGASTLTIPQNTGCSITSDGTNYQISACTAKGRNDLAIDFSGVPGNSQKYTYVTGRAFTLPASLTGSKAVIGTNPTSSLTVTMNKNGSSIGTIVFSTGGSPTTTFSSSTSFAAGDILTLVCPGTADATGADIAITLLGTLN